MLARVLFLLSFIVLSKRAFVLELTETIELYPRETVVVDSPYRENSKNMWVVGRFPSHKIVPLEGRLGDRFSEKKDKEGTLLQTWSFVTSSAVPGDELHVEFWYLNPLYAEQYYNDPEAYEAMHDEEVETRVLVFKVISGDL